jgi:hypothetical protein
MVLFWLIVLGVVCPMISGGLVTLGLLGIDRAIVKLQKAGV